MIAWTCGGAPAGATARPSGPTVACGPLFVAGAAAAAGGGAGAAAGAAGGGRGAERLDVGRVHHAVDRALVRGLEGLDRPERPAAELAVDRHVVAGVAEEVLQHADVVAVHALLHRDAVAEALRPAAPAADRGGAAADVGALAASGRFQRRDRLAPDRPARRELGGALEALDRADGARPEVTVDRDGEPCLAKSLLE